ncbi:MAG: pilus assembly protein [Lachnospiraceae bacterium]|nr:pilus assembly protein [Lachnospiraceae bacterium]
MRNKGNGYMTVEASLVMSLVMMVYLFLIEYALWGYDRYILERDLAGMLLHCANAVELDTVWQQEKRDWEEKEYLWTGEKKVELEKGLLTLKITGVTTGGNMGNIKAGYEMWDLKPQQWLRGKEKLQDKREEGE